uniref:HTH CENPB-type domain-containing protein n=1 Tax=Timema shepardi TaxID=629360 RepID=A0A7R9ANY7_TIMSH|nr:unnamed protein product [Timema shepardi]
MVGLGRVGNVPRDKLETTSETHAMLGSGSVTYPRRAAAATSTSLLARPRLGALRSYVRPRGAHPSTPDMARSRKSKARESGKQFWKTTLTTPDQDSRLVLHVIDSLDYCESNPSDHAATERSSGVAPNEPVLKRKAEQLAKLLDNNKEFVCSEGWLDRWKSRHVIMAGKVRGKRAQHTLSKKTLSFTIMPEPVLREQQCSLYLAVPPSSPHLSYLRMRTTVKHPVADTVKRTVPYKEFGIFSTNWGMATEVTLTDELTANELDAVSILDLKKFNGYHKMDSGKKRTPDYTDIAYREAVSRLRYLLAESYAPSPSKYSQDSDNETEASFAASDRSRHGHTHSHYRSQAPYRPSVFGSRRALYSDTMPKLTHGYSTLNVPHGEVTDAPIKPEGAAQPPTELMAFIERQEEYIEQLEKESQFCRISLQFEDRLCGPVVIGSGNGSKGSGFDSRCIQIIWEAVGLEREELSHLLGKVKEVISENEGLHEKEKAGLLKSVFDSYETGDDEDDHDMDSEEKLEKRKPLETKKKRLEGPSIVFESRISELEAQLTQTKLDLKKALEEADLYKKKLTDQHYGSDLSHSSGSPDSQRQQIDTLQRQVVAVIH